MTHAGRRLSPLLAATLLLLLVAPQPAQALEVTTGPRVRVIGGLDQQRVTVHLDDGAVARGDLLRFDEDDGGLSLRPRLADGTVSGIDTMRSLSDEVQDAGGAGGVNGGYWLGGPNAGAPNGVYVDDGRLLAGQKSTASGHDRAGGAVGIDAAGMLAFDRLDIELTLTRPDGAEVVIDEINRAPRHTGGDDADPSEVDGEVIVYTPQYGRSAVTPADATIVFTDDLAIGSSGQATATVTEVRSGRDKGNFAVRPGTGLVVAHGTHAPELAGIEAGDTITVATRIRPDLGGAAVWNDLTYALPGGPLLLRGHVATDLASWRDEAFSDDHLMGRQPRTAIARTGGDDREILLLTVDGRQNGWSVGLSIAELIDVLEALGARDALNLDGGGSTTMTIGGRIHNRPSESGRSVANALFVHAPMPPGARDITADACDPAEVEPSGFDDIADNIHRPAIECLAWWEITTGMTPTSYATAPRVTRAQMASFVARFVDVASDRGSGRPLPDADTSPFDDVRYDSEHGRAIARLEAAGITEGKGGGRFSPAADVGRAEMATFLARAYEHSTGDQLPRERDSFLDDTGSTHERNIDRLAASGISEGLQGLRFGPGKPVQRAAMASFVMRTVDLLVAEGVTSPPG